MAGKRPQSTEIMLYPGVVLRGSQTFLLKPSNSYAVTLHPMAMPIVKVHAPARKPSAVPVDKTVYNRMTRRGS